MTIGWLWLALALGMTALGQIVFKYASMRHSLRFTLLAIVIFCVVPPASYMALHTLSLATVYVSTALSQLVVVIASMLLFDERYVPRQWFGLMMILAGVILFNFKALT